MDDDLPSVQANKEIGNQIIMLLTIFLAIVFCVAITIMMFAAVAFIQDAHCFETV